MGGRESVLHEQQGVVGVVVVVVVSGWMEEGRYVVCTTRNKVLAR